MKTTMTIRVRDLATLGGVFISIALATAVSSQAKENLKPPIPLIQFENVPLDTAIENLARQADLNYILSPKIPTRAITARWENLPAKAALTKLLAENNLFLVENPATTVTHVSTTNRIESPVDAKWIVADTNNVIPLIQFTMVPLPVALTQLSRNAGPNVVVDLKRARTAPSPSQPPAESATASVRWKNLKPRQALAALCENYNLLLVKDDATGGVRITPK